jgi:hypothetical protein
MMYGALPSVGAYLAKAFAIPAPIPSDQNPQVRDYYHLYHLQQQQPDESLVSRLGYLLLLLKERAFDFVAGMRRSER